jgi:hypothetical protein
MMKTIIQEHFRLIYHRFHVHSPLMNDTIVDKQEKTIQYERKNDVKEGDM